MIKSRSTQARARSTPTGCRLMKPTAWAPALSVAAAVCFAAFAAPAWRSAVPACGIAVSAKTVSRHFSPAPGAPGPPRGLMIRRSLIYLDSARWTAFAGCSRIFFLTKREPCRRAVSPASSERWAPRCPHSPVPPQRACHARSREPYRQRPGPPASPGRAFWVASALPAYLWPPPAFPRAFPYGAWTRRPVPAGSFAEILTSGHFVQRCRCPQPQHHLGSRPQRPRQDRRCSPRSLGVHWLFVLAYSVFASFFKSSGRVVSRL